METFAHGEAEVQPRLETARVIPQKVWDQYHLEIAELYIKKEWPLADLMEHMEVKYNLKATDTQWKKQFAKWGLRRNLNQADAAHVLRLYTEARHRGLKRQVSFNGKVIPLQQISRYIKKSKKFNTEDELLATLPQGSIRPEHIAYEDLTSSLHSPYYHYPFPEQPNVVLPDVEVGDSMWLNIRSGFGTPNRSKLATPLSSVSHRSSFSSFDMAHTDMTGMSMEAVVNTSLEEFMEEDAAFQMQESPQEAFVDDITKRCIAYGDSLWLSAATKEMLTGNASGQCSDASGYGYLSSTPVAMLHQPSPYMVQSENRSDLGNSKATGTREPHMSMAGSEDEECEATKFLGRCFHACICIGQSLEEGVDWTALTGIANHAIDEAMQSFARMILNRDGATLSTISILLTMLEVHGQLDLAHRLLRRTLEVSNENLGADHALSSTIKWMLAVTSRNSHFGHEFSAQKLEGVKVGIEMHFGDGSPSALTATYNFGWALLHEKQYVRAGEVLFRLRSDSERILGFRHVHTIITSVTLARVFFHQGDVANAEMLINEMIGRLNQVFPTFHPYRLEALSRQARFLTKLGKKDEAETLLREVVAQRFSILGPANDRSRSSLEDLHKAMLSRGHTVDIKDLYRQVSDQCVRLESQRKLLAYLV